MSAKLTVYMLLLAALGLAQAPAVVRAQATGQANVQAGDDVGVDATDGVDASAAGAGDGVALGASEAGAAEAADASDLPSPGVDDKRLKNLARRLAGDTASPSAASAVEPSATTSDAAAGDDAIAAKPAPTTDAPPPVATAHEKLPLGQSVKGAAAPASSAEGDAAPSTQSASASRSVVPAESKSGSWWLDSITALGVVLVLILLLRSVLARVGGRPIAARQSSVVEVLARVPVAPRNHVLLLRLGERVLVVGDSAAGLRTLANLDDPEEVACLLAHVNSSRSSSISSSFSQLFRRFDAGDHLAGRLPEEGGDDSEYVADRARDQVTGLLSRLRTLKRGGGA